MTAGRGMRGYLAAVRRDEDRCVCGHPRRSHGVASGRRCGAEGCRCPRFRLPDRPSPVPVPPDLLYEPRERCAAHQVTNYLDPEGRVVAGVPDFAGDHDE